MAVVAPMETLRHAESLIVKTGQGHYSPEAAAAQLVDSFAMDRVIERILDGAGDRFSEAQRKSFERLYTQVFRKKLTELFERAPSRVKSDCEVSAPKRSTAVARCRWSTDEIDGGAQIFFVRRKGQWRIENVRSPDINLIQQHRTQIQGIVTKKGVDALLRALERRLAR